MCPFNRAPKISDLWSQIKNMSFIAKKTSYNWVFQNYKITVYYTANFLQRERLIISNSSAMQKTEWETDL